MLKTENVKNRKGEIQMLKTKKIISAFLALLMLISIFSSFSVSVGAEATPINKVVALTIPGDAAYFDSESTNTSDVIWESWRQVFGVQSVTYKYTLPDNTVNISNIQAYQLWEGANGIIEISKDKTTWTPATTSETASGWLYFTPQNQSFLSNNPTKTIYVKVSHSGAASTFFYSAFNLNYQTGEEPAYNATFTAGSIAETGRVFSNSTGGDATVSGGQWNIWGGGYVTYRLDLPNDTGFFKLNAVCWGNVIVNISKDNTNWTQTYANAEAPQQLNLVGSSINGDFLTNNADKVVYIKVSSGGAMAMSSFGFIAYASENSYSGTFNVTTLNESSRLYETAGPYIFAADNQKSLLASSLTYRLDLPDDTESFVLNSFLWGYVDVSVSKDNINWVPTFTSNKINLAQNVYSVGRSSQGDFFSGNPNKVIFVKFASGKDNLDADNWLAIRSVGFSANASAKLSSYTVGTNSQLGATTDAVLVLGESKGLIDTEFVDSATESIFWNPSWAVQNYWRLIQNNTTASLIYRIYLPDACSNVNFNTFNNGDLVVEISKDKSNWVSSTTTANAGLGSYYFTSSNQTFLDGNPTKVIYVKLTSLNAAGTIVGGFYVEYNMHRQLTKVNPGKTAGEFKSETMPLLAEYEVKKPPYGINDALLATDKLGTGNVVQYFIGDSVSSYTIVIKGDITGEGVIGLTDLAAAKAHLLKITALSGAYESAADINNDGKVSISDLLSVKKDILGIALIVQ
jgi:hypothetical protein